MSVQETHSNFETQSRASGHLIARVDYDYSSHRMYNGRLKENLEPCRWAPLAGLAALPIEAYRPT